MTRLPTDGPPRIGDYVVYARPAVAGNPPGVREVWDRRRTTRSLVIAHLGHSQWQLVTHGDSAADSWTSLGEHLRVIGRAAWAMLDDNLDAGVAAEALRGSTVALDFDGPIHSYRSGWTGYVPEDPPTPGALEFVRFLLDAGARVVVHTSRADCHRGRAGVTHYLVRHGFPPLEVTYEKVPAAAYVDDRAVHFDARKRLPYDDGLLAEVVRMCRTRHHGEAHEPERFGDDPGVTLTKGAELIGGRDDDHCGDPARHGPHPWMPKPPRVGVSRDCPGSVLPPDTQSSASVQHYVDTGSYLAAGEAEGSG